MSVAPQRRVVRTVAGPIWSDSPAAETLKSDLSDARARGALRVGIETVVSTRCRNVVLYCHAARIIAKKLSSGTYSGMLLPLPRAYPPRSRVRSTIALDR